MCIDAPEDSSASAPSGNCSPACGTNEVCINGYCDYAGTPCFFDTQDTFIGVFCAKN